MQQQRITWRHSPPSWKTLAGASQQERKREGREVYWGMNRKARKAIRKKTKTWKKYRQTGNAEEYEQYRKALNKATTTVRKAKGDFEIKLAAEIKRDSKSFSSYARSKLRTKEQIGPLPTWLVNWSMSRNWWQCYSTSSIVQFLQLKIRRTSRV